jgi:hypothetical protein
LIYFAEREERSGATMSGHTPRRDLHPKPDDPSLVGVCRPGWTAYILCAAATPTAVTPNGFHDKVDDLVDALVEWRGCVSTGRERGAYSATFSLYTETTSVAEVVHEALAVFSGAARQADMPPWPIVRCEVLTFEELDRDLDEGGYAAILELNDDEGAPGWSMRTRATTDLVIDAWSWAITRRRPLDEVANYCDHRWSTCRCGS